MTNKAIAIQKIENALCELDEIAFIAGISERINGIVDESYSALYNAKLDLENENLKDLENNKAK